VPEERAWLRDPTAVADSRSPAPPYRQDSRASPAAAEADGADQRGGDDEEMATAGGEAPDGGAAEAGATDDNEAVAERLRALFRSCGAALRPGLVRRCQIPYCAEAALPADAGRAGQRLGHRCITTVCRQPMVMSCAWTIEVIVRTYGAGSIRRLLQSPSDARDKTDCRRSC